MIIKDLRNCGLETQQRLKELEASSGADSAELELARRKMSALYELSRYAMSGKWTREASWKKYLALVKSKFDYRLVAKEFGTTRESLDVFAWRQDKRLKRVIGEALRLIELDRIDEGLDCFFAASGEFSEREFDYNVSEVLAEVQKKDSVLVSECGEEVEILRSLMRLSVEKRLNGGDLGKLGYLVFLLHTNDDMFMKQKRELVSKLRKKDS